MQVFLGGILSGMKAGLAYPTWPDMNGQAIPTALYTEKPTIDGVLQYLPQDFWGKTFIQFVHRLTAYTLVILIAVFYFRSKSITTDSVFKKGLSIFPWVVLLQAAIGIITVLSCVGKIPVLWGVVHQAGAMLLIAEVVFVIFHLTNTTDTSGA
jgi:cytochrome c oxidase assembly protein subunit 15